MKKILYFIDTLEMGGIQKLTLDWISNIDKNNFEIDILTLDSSKKENLEDNFNKIGCKVYKLNDVWIRTPLDYLKYNFECNKFFKRNHEYDIVELHSSSKNYPILKYAKKYGIKTRISHSHNIGFQTKNKFKILVGNMFKKKLIKYSTDFLACSLDAGKWLFGEKIVNSNKFKIIYNSIDFENFKFNKNIRTKIRKELGFNDNTFVIGHVGRFNSQKNHVFLINIFEKISKKIPNSYLILLGEGNLKKNIEKMVDEKKLSNKVMFLGVKNNANEYMQAMDAFVFPSLYEGLGIVLVEAQAAGLKTFTSKRVIPIEAKISDNIKFIDLKKDNYDEWTETILKEDYNYKREEVILDKTNYDLRNTIKKLEEYYISK